MIVHYIFLQFMEQIPMMLADLGCIIAACILWRRAPLSSLLVLLACSVPLLFLIVYPFAYELVLHSFASDAQTTRLIYVLSGVANALVGATFTTLLVIAVYSGRKRPEVK